MVDIEINPYLKLFQKQKNRQPKIGSTNYKYRIDQLNKLQFAIEKTYRKQIIEALQKDLGKPKVESELTEIYQIVGEIKHAKKYLHKWMRQQKV